MNGFHPRIMLRATVQGYIDGIPSSRALARHCKTDLIYIYLLGGKCPDFRTINIFYKDYADLISRTQYEIVQFAKEIDKCFYILFLKRLSQEL